MKLTLLILSLVLNTLAHGQVLPQIGDHILYRVSEPNRTLLWLKEVVKVDLEKERLTLVTHVKNENEVEWQDHRYSFWPFDHLKKADHLLSENLKNCTSEGGTIQTLGSVQTCKIISEDTPDRRVTFWWANVPVTQIIKREIFLKQQNSVQTIEQIAETIRDSVPQTTDDSAQKLGNAATTL